MTIRRASLELMVATLAASALLLTARSVYAADGEWVSLGVPANLRSPLLWDDAGKRLVGLSASQLCEPDSVRDAWEFREGAGWRHLALPKPPEGVCLSSVLVFADRAHDRFLTFSSDTYPSRLMRLWALELEPTPQWRALDSAPAVPGGVVLLDPNGESAWLRTTLWSMETHELWSRSLADTGAWRKVRDLPPSPLLRNASWVEPQRGRLYEIGELLDRRDSTVVLSLELAGDGGWTTEPGPVPRELHGRHVEVGETNLAGDGRVLLTVESDQPSAAWGFHYDAETRWTSLGPLGQVFTSGAFGWARDTLWFHGANGAPYQGGVATLAYPLTDLGHPVTYGAPEWPPFSSPAMFVHDRAGQRWLYGGMGFVFTAPHLPADTLWELKLAGDEAAWRKIALAGETPRGGDYMCWAQDEQGNEVYRMEQRDGTYDTDPEVWALRLDGEPRWRKLEYSGAGPRMSQSSMLAFDPVRRELIHFGGVDYQPKSLTALAVDQPGMWQPRAAEGAVPDGGDPWVGAFDARRNRFLFRAYTASIAALEMGDTMRWRTSSAPYCPGIGGDCVPGLSYVRGLYDPIGDRMLLLGGYDFWFMESYGSLVAIECRDSLGPVRTLAPLGTAGNQMFAIAGYDGSRDALVVFGSVSTFGPTLSEFRFHRDRPVARLTSAQALADRNRLRWRATEGASFSLWRSTIAGAWAQVTSLRAGPDGTLDYDDHAVDAGQRYGYRLTAPAQPEMLAADDVWLLTSSTPTVALAAPWPNPSRGALNVAFVSRAGAAAELECFDLAGRRVWSRRWDAPTAGPHHVLVPAGELPRSGLYFLRLRQAGVTATRRVVLAR